MAPSVAAATILLVLAGALILVAYRAAQSAGFFWMDDYTHLLISRSVFDDPSNLLHVWGRPLMTLPFLPASQLGDGAARITSLLLLVGTATACVGVCRRHCLALAPAAAVLLLVQPTTASAAAGAVAVIPFSFLLATALWLRSSDRPALAALVASLLPLARLEGLLVLVIWGVVLLVERRMRVVPALAMGMGAWIVVSSIASGDPLWLWDNNPYGVLGSEYGRAGWRYGFVAWPTAFGPVVGGLALAALGRRHLFDPLVGALAAGLPAFYVLAWGLPAFQSIATPLYLVSAAVPVALCAQQPLHDLWSGTTPRRLSGEASALAIALLSGSVRLVLVVLAVLLAFRARHSTTTAWRPAAAVTLVVAGLVNLGVVGESLPLRGVPAAARTLADGLSGDSDRVVASTVPAFDWYADRRSVFTKDDPRFAFAASVRHGDQRALVVWSPASRPSLATAEELERWGYRVREVVPSSEGPVVLYERVYR